MSRAKTDEEKAAFLRAVGGVHGEWSPIGHDGLGPDETLSKLVLGPPPVAKSTEPPRPKGIAASLLKQHEIQFAHSRVRPPAPKPPESEAVVPRAVSAKRAAERGAKAQKRSS